MPVSDSPEMGDHNTCVKSCYQTKREVEHRMYQMRKKRTKENVQQKEQTNQQKKEKKNEGRKG